MTRTIKATIFVGGPAHGRQLDNVVVDDEKLKWLEPAQARAHITPQGIGYSTPPNAEHIYQLRKMVTDSRFGTPIMKHVLVHESLIDVAWDKDSTVGNRLWQRQLKEAIIDALLRAFL